MHTTTIKVLFSAIALAALAACGGGGDGETTDAGTTDTPVTTPAYNYAALNGDYDCRKTGQAIGIGVKATFTESQLTVGLSASAIAGNAVLVTEVIKDKVGFVSDYPYYSKFIPLTANAETYFFFNGKLTIVTGPVADIPNLLAQRPTSVYNCTKKA